MTDYGYKKCLELGNGIGSKICWNVKPVIRSSPKSIVEALSNGCAKVILDEINNDIYEEFKNMIGDFNMEKCSVVDVKHHCTKQGRRSNFCGWNKREICM